MSNLEYIIENIMTYGSCKCPQCEIGTIYPRNRNKEAKEQHIFECNNCNNGVRTMPKIVVE